MKLIKEEKSNIGLIRIYEITYFYNSKLNINIYTDKPNDDYIKRIHKAMCTFDILSNMYTISSIDKGGPILCDYNLSKIIDKYKEIFILSLSITKLKKLIKDNNLY